MIDDASQQVVKTTVSPYLARPRVIPKRANTASPHF